MNHPENSTAHGEFGAGYWEDRYRSGEGGTRYSPSPSLVTEAGDLAPGWALDAGCGRGADAVWLAARSWQVTAVDASATALELARETARSAGQDVADRIEWVRADLTHWSPGEGRFDLVTSHYVHVPGPAEDLFRRLSSWVAPGGTLLVVGHDHTAGHDQAKGRDHAEGPGHEPAAGSHVRVQQITAGLPADEWEIVVAQSRTHTIRRPDGAGAVTLHDAVVRARRLTGRLDRRLRRQPHDDGEKPRVGRS